MGKINGEHNTHFRISPPHKLYETGAPRSGKCRPDSFDGKLLRQYDIFGVLLKDFIYMGNRLIAEYDRVSDLEIVRESGI